MPVTVQGVSTTRSSSSIIHKSNSQNSRKSAFLTITDLLQRIQLRNMHMEEIHWEWYGKEWGAQGFHALPRHCTLSQHMDVFTDPNLSKCHRLGFFMEVPLYRHNWARSPDPLPSLEVQEHLAPPSNHVVDFSYQSPSWSYPGPSWVAQLVRAPMSGVVGSIT